MGWSIGLVSLPSCSLSDRRLLANSHSSVVQPKAGHNRRHSSTIRQWFYRSILSLLVYRSTLSMMACKMKAGTILSNDCFKNHGLRCILLFVRFKIGRATDIIEWSLKNMSGWDVNILSNDRFQDEQKNRHNRMIANKMSIDDQLCTFNLRECTLPVCIPVF